MTVFPSCLNSNAGIDKLGFSLMRRSSTQFPSSSGIEENGLQIQLIQDGIEY